MTQKEMQTLDKLFAEVRELSHKVQNIEDAILGSDYIGEGIKEKTDKNTKDIESINQKFKHFYFFLKMAIQTKGRLFFDIETSPNIGFFWQSGYKLQVPYTNIIKERAIICICYKWENDKKVYSLNWDKDQCDKQMLIDFIKIND
jgi:hypothetical protein